MDSPKCEYSPIRRCFWPGFSQRPFTHTYPWMARREVFADELRSESLPVRLVKVSQFRIGASGLLVHARPFRRGTHPCWARRRTYRCWRVLHACTIFHALQPRPQRSARHLPSTCRPYLPFSLIFFCLSISHGTYMETLRWSRKGTGQVWVYGTCTKWT